MKKNTSQPVNYDKNSTDYWKKKNPQFYIHDDEPVLGTILLIPVITTIVVMIWVTIIKYNL